MAWEQRSGRSYMYRVFRDDAGKVQRKYLGNGPAAVMEAARLQDRKQRIAADRHQLSQLQAQQSQLTVALQEFDEGVQMLIEAELLARGFHKHAGTWRFTREKRDKQ